MRCTNCDNEFRESELQDGICNECYNEIYASCESCQCEVVREEGYYQDGEIFCEVCYHDNYFHCDGCSDVVCTDDRYSTDNGDAYCQDCYNERYVECQNCGREIDIDSSIYLEEQGLDVCSRCESRLNPIISDGRILDYSIKPNPVFLNTPYDNKLHFGSELEIVVPSNKDREDIAVNLHKWMKKHDIDKAYYFKHDGSIGYRGFEIVSHPFSKAYSKNLKIKKMLERLRTMRCKSYKVKGLQCGIHIHMSRDFFTNKDCAKLARFFSVNKEQIKILSRRGDEFLKRGGTNWCRPINYSISNLKEYLVGGYNNLPRQHTDCINFRSSTIEIRMFRGTLDYITYLANVKFCESLAYYVKSHSTKFFARGWQTGLWNHYKKWLADSGRYTEVEKYFDKVNI